MKVTLNDYNVMVNGQEAGYYRQSLTGLWIANFKKDGKNAIRSATKLNDLRQLLEIVFRD